MTDTLRPTPLTPPTSTTAPSPAPKPVSEAAAGDLYIVNFSHMKREDPYVTFWRPDDKGYCYPLSWAGRYSREAVQAHPGYYNNGSSTLAVSCAVIDALGVPTPPQTIDNDAGPVVLNTKLNWARILAAAVWVPAHPPQPLYSGARYPKPAKPKTKPKLQPGVVKQEPSGWKSLEIHHPKSSKSPSI